MTPPFNDLPGQQPAIIIRMAELIARERLARISDPEKEELDRWLAEDAKNQAWKDQLSDAAYFSQLLASYESAETAVETSLKVFHERYLDGAPVVRMRRNPSKWWVAAAVLIPFLVAGIWLANRKAPGPVAKASVQPVIPAGRNTATLTLSNGSHVLLDTGMSGQLAQNGARIDYKDGHIDYHGQGRSGRELTYNTLSTAKGGQYQLALPDGTKVWLNAMSSIRYPTAFTGSDRHVELTGEAYFEVAAHKEQPFTVGVSGMNIKVLGTEFDVMAYPGEGKKLTTLVQGAVKVENGNEGRQLSMGQQAIVTDGGALSVASNIDIESVTAWKIGFFQFSHTELRTIMREIARWYDVDLVYQRQDLTSEYGGRISRKLNLSDLISLLEGNGVGHFRLEGRRLIVLP